LEFRVSAVKVVPNRVNAELQRRGVNAMGRRRKRDNTGLYILVGVVVLAVASTTTLSAILYWPQTKKLTTKTAQQPAPREKADLTPIPREEPAPVEPVKLEPRKIEPVKEVNVFKRIEDALRAGGTSRSTPLGGGRRDFLDVPEVGAILTGLEVGIGKWQTQDVIHSLRPIFLSRRGRLLGSQHGVRQARTVTLEARSGYAIGSMTVRSGAGLDAISVTFMAIDGERLDPTRSYQSEHVGGMGGNENSLSGDGEPIIGIFGKLHATDDVTNALGLVLVKR
jgi:hypothetical protein